MTPHPHTPKTSVRRSSLATWPLALTLGAGLVALSAVPARAQIDPLLFVKRVPPTVVVVLDTSFSMLTDGSGNYYDPRTYSVTGDPVAAAAGVTSGTSYRRVYRRLEFTTGVGNKYRAETVVGVSNLAPGYGSFWADTRIEIARRGLYAAVEENAGTSSEETSGWLPRWGLIRLRQSSPALATACDRPVDVIDVTFAGVNDGACAAAGAGRLGVWAPTVTAASFSNTAAAPAGTFLARPECTRTSDTGCTGAPLNTPTSIMSVLNSPVPSNTQIIPAGRDTYDYQDRPLRLGLVDALAKARAAVTNDAVATSGCRNTVIVLVTGGKDDGDAAYRGSSVTSQAAQFATVNVGGINRRMPIYVVAIRPAAADELQLQAIATQSGGRYFRVSSAGEVKRAVNLAVQAGYSNKTDFDQGLASEYAPVSPIVGTVNLVNAKSASGALLPDTSIVNVSGFAIPQRSNVMITAGFALGGLDAGGTEGPGFEGRVRAFRTFTPVTDATKSSGFRFTKDGTPLWPLGPGDPRAELAGIARTPPDPDTRNIYTYVPGTGMVELSVANAGALQAHLGGADPLRLIPFVRQLPIGAVIGSTPALMDPPSLDPPPDADYGAPNSTGTTTYAGRLRNRRAIIWFGANDGMVHGVDARTGYEVWAFVPFNLLPKLKTLMDGQPVHQFEYFVDSSPKIAEVKVNGTWKSLLIIGQGPGGTFYQAFDVTEAGMGSTLPDSDDYATVLASFASPSRVPLLWSFPDYAEFETDLAASGTANPLSVSDATPGGRLRLYGDLRATAPAVSKSVGFTWSDPAVGALTPTRSLNAVIVGSGYFPDVEGLLPGRSADSPVVKAGRSFYLIDVETGRVVGNPSSCAGAIGCIDVGNLANPPWKNALQADPTAAGTPGSYVVTKAYMGDLDGRYWRFNFTQTGSITATSLVSTGQPIYNSSALLMVGTTEQYVFFSTGSDLLPTVASAGGDNGPYKLYGVRDYGTSATTTFANALAWQNATYDNKGNLKTPGLYERPSSSPSVAGDIVFFTTTTESPGSVCSSLTCDPATAGACGLVGNLYAFTYQGTAAYDTTGDDALNTNSKKGSADSTKVKTVAGRATAPFIVDQHLYFATSGPNGANVEAFGNPDDFNNGVGQVGVRILSWREMR